MAEIITKTPLVFWEIWRYQKDILKLTDIESVLEMHEQADGKKYLEEGELVGNFYRETKWIKINGHSIPAPQFMIKERFDQLWEMYNEVHNFLLWLKVSKNRNDFMKTSFLPKSNEIILRISALLLII